MNVELNGSRPRTERPGLELLEITNAIVRIHKQLLGRGPTRVRAEYAGPDTLVATIEDSLTVAERTMMALGEHHSVREMRRLLERASDPALVETVERISGRRVRAFVSGTDPHHDVSSEVFYLEPVPSA